MRQYQVYASIVALFLVCGEAKAGDKEDVLATMAQFYAAANAGDVDALRFSSHTRYNVNGELLQTSDPVKVKAWFKGAFASGLKMNLQPSHENVEVYGNTAIFTCYERVNVNPPDGAPINDTRRLTVVLVKEKGEWNTVHVHLSYLKPVNPE